MKNKYLLLKIFIFTILICGCTLAKYVLTSGFLMKVITQPFYFDVEIPTSEVILIDNQAEINLEIKNNDGTNYNSYDTSYEIILQDNVNYAMSIDDVNNGIINGNSIKSNSIKLNLEKISANNVENIHLKIKSIAPYKKEIDVVLNVKNGYRITYINIDNNGYPTEVLEGENLDITFINDLPDGVLITGATTYSYNDYNLKIDGIKNNIVIRDAVVFEHADAYTFNGNNYIDTGVSLFSEENYNKNFEVTFTINNKVTEQESYAALFNSMNEADKFFRGITFRIDYYNSEYDCVSDDEGPNSTLDHASFVYDFSKVSKVKLYRIDDILYISVNDGSLTKVRDYTNFESYFDLPAFFGASADASGNPFRYFKGTLSNMRIKLLANDGIQEFDI